MIRDSFDDIYYPENVIELINQNTDEKMVDHIRNANRDYMDTVAMTYSRLRNRARKVGATPIFENEHGRPL